MNLSEQSREKAILVGLNAACFDRLEACDETTMDELEELLHTAGGECVARVIQTRDAPEPGTFVGEGKLEEIRDLAERYEAELIVFDNELSPSQIRAIEEATKVRVIDRSQLILDIFAQRAQTREGRLQVELAQLKYILPRLTGMWGHLVRQTASGGKSPIGTRGPGETQLETDRRHIRRKISKLEEELQDVRRVRNVQRKSREKSETPVIALIGYTNVGKSTLLNTLTGSDIMANNRLFDTLDPTTRSFTLSDGTDVLFTDTVGFIRKLPHHLIEAFKATLEELKYADILLHVIDISSEDWIDQVEVVDSLIYELGAEGTPQIRVYNKIDQAETMFIPHESGSVAVSAVKRIGLEELTSEIEKILNRGKRTVTLLIPYSETRIMDLIYSEGESLEVDYQEDGIRVRVKGKDSFLGKLKNYILA